MRAGLVFSSAKLCFGMMGSGVEKPPEMGRIK